MKIRPYRTSDAADFLDLVCALAEYEKLEPRSRAVDGWRTYRSTLRKT